MRKAHERQEKRSSSAAAARQTMPGRPATAVDAGSATCFAT